MLEITVKSIFVVVIRLVKKNFGVLMLVVGLLMLVYIVRSCVQEVADRSTIAEITIMLNNQSPGFVYMWVGDKAEPDKLDLIELGQYRSVRFSAQAYERDNRGEAHGESSDQTTILTDHVVAHVQPVDESTISRGFDLNFPIEIGKSVWITWGKNGALTMNYGFLSDGPMMPPKNI